MSFRQASAKPTTVAAFRCAREIIAPHRIAVSAGAALLGCTLASVLALAPAQGQQAGRDGPPFPAVEDVDRLQSGERIYMSACAACHGADGTGAPRARLGVDVPLPDFTDCSFASREPTADWVGVAHEGGPIRAFSKFMPAFGDALSVEQLEAAIGHIRTFCTSAAWPRGEFNLPRPLVTTKAYPEDEAVVTTTIGTEDPGSVEVEAVYEKRIFARSQVELAVPFGWKETADGDWRSVLGDVVVGYKRVLYDDLGVGTIVSGNVELALPTGDEEAGFSNDTVVVEPSLLFGQILPNGFFLQGQAGIDLPFDDDEVEEEAFWRLVGGRMINEGRWGRRWTPMVEVLGAREFVDGADINWDIVPQLQVTLSRRQHVRLGVGARVPLNNTAERETQVGLYLLWDWYDGWLFEGW